MAEQTYERLSFLDGSFLIAERPNSFMHVAGTAVFDAASLKTPEGGVDIDRIRSFVNSKLHAIPRYRQVIAYTPIEGHPIWVDDPHFHIDYHVRHTALPKPGTDAQLKRLSSRVMSQPLDRARPLWEMWIVEGLHGGNRFAMVSKVHHCMIDGMSSVDLLTVLLAPEPTEHTAPAPEWTPRPAPGLGDFLAAEATRRLGSTLNVVRSVPGLLQSVRDPRSDLRAMFRAVRGMLGSGVRMVSDTPLNRPIGPHRRFDWLSMELAEVKEVRKRLGGSLNDVVLATVSGAVRRYLERKRVRIKTLDFRVMAPVSVRSDDERGKLGNRVSAWIVPLPLTEKDPVKRLAAISATTTELKQSKQAVGAEMLTRVVEWTPSTLLSLGAQMLTRALPFNLVVTNVPGPQVPLYLLGSKMLANYGQVPLVDYLGLGIVLFSYAGRLCWGLNADWDVVADVDEFALDVRAAFAELCDAAGIPAAGKQAAGTSRATRAKRARADAQPQHTRAGAAPAERRRPRGQTASKAKPAARGRASKDRPPSDAATDVEPILEANRSTIRAAAARAAEVPRWPAASGVTLVGPQDSGPRKAPLVPGEQGESESEGD